MKTIQIENVAYEYRSPRLYGHGDARPGKVHIHSDDVYVRHVGYVCVAACGKRANAARVIVRENDEARFVNCRKCRRKIGYSEKSDR